MSFKVGDEVIVASQHTYQGRAYSSECEIGSVGEVIDTYDDTENYLHVKWRSHPDGWNRRPPGRNSNIDKACVKINGPSEEELDAEAAKLFGVRPTKPANHCPTCTCEEEV